MKLLFKTFILFTLIASCSCKTKKHISPEESSIRIPTDSTNSLKNTARDVVSLLSKNSRVKYAENSYINCVKKKESFFDKSKIDLLSSASINAFYVKSHQGTYWIYAKEDQGLENGMYYLLEKLGYRFYFPGELWTVKPSTMGYIESIDEIVIPEFRNINFFGTGGLPQHKIIDPTNQRKNKWDTWKNRLRFRDEIHLAGHAGESFNTVNKNLLIGNSEFLAEVDGKRVKWSRNAKMCISNPSARLLFQKDRIKKYHKSKKSQAISISVEPSDGYNHCTCPDCLKMGTVSTRVFFRANEIAEKISNLSSDDHVNLLAYNEHADVPHLDIEDNVIVTLVPYAFQQISAPEKFIKEWCTKKEGNYMYDYLGTPVWDQDIPSTDFLVDLPNKMKFWKEHGIVGVKMESSYSIGATGLPLYFYNKLAWDLNLDTKIELQDLCNNLFGNASSPMFSLFTRWSCTTESIYYNLDLDLIDLKKAAELSDDKRITERINQFKAYVHYIVMLREFQNDNHKTREKLEDLISYIWTNYDNLFIHSSSIHNWLINRYHKITELNKEEWAITPKNIQIPVWKSMQAISDDEIVSNFNKDYASFVGLVPRAKEYKNLDIKDIQSSRVHAPVFQFDQDQEFSFYKTSDVFVLHCKASRSDKRIPGSIVALYDKENELVRSENILRNSKRQSFNWSDIPDGYYTLKFKVKRCLVDFELESPSIQLFTPKLNCVKCPEQIAFIPSHEKEIIHTGSSKAKKSLRKKINSKDTQRTNGGFLNLKGHQNKLYESLNGKGLFAI